MIEYLEADLTGAPIDASNTGYTALAEVENVDESITTVAKAINDMEIYLQEVQKKE